MSNDLSEMAKDKCESDFDSVDKEVMEAQEELFDIEKIIKSVVQDGETLYRVKWAGLKSNKNTWEGIETFKNCPEMITNYEKEVKAKEEKKCQDALDRKLKAIQQKEIKRNVGTKMGAKGKGKKKAKMEEKPSEGGIISQQKI